MTALPYTVAVNLDIGVQNAAISNSVGVADRALVQTELLETINFDALQTSTDKATYEELGGSSSVQTNYGSGGPSLYTDFFNVWNDKLFYSFSNFFGVGDSRNYIDYFYTDYTAGGTFGSVPWTLSTDLIDDLTWHFPRGVCMPVTWHGLTNAVLLVADTIPLDLSVRGRVVSESGESTITKICSIPDISPAPPGLDFIIPDTTKNWFLTRMGGGTPYLSTWTSDSTTGVNLTEDLLTFASADVNTMVAELSDGNWIITPTHWIFYTARDVWDSDLGLTSSNGIVVVRLTKDFTSYTVEFVTWGDSEAQAKLDVGGIDGYLTVDSFGNLYYVDPFLGTPGAVISTTVSSLPLDTPDPMPRLSTAISLGASGGPGFLTTIAPADRGNRFKEWQRVRGTYQISFTGKDQSLVEELLTFFRARNGRARSFRFKDWSDYLLPDPGSGLLYSDQFETDGTTNHFQLVKVYDDAASSPYTRHLRRPVQGTVKVYDDGGLTADFSVDYTAGIVYLGPTTSATTGHVISVSCEFDVRARFDTDSMVVSIKNFQVYEWRNVPIVELKDG